MSVNISLSTKIALRTMYDSHQGLWIENLSNPGVDIGTNYGSPGPPDIHHKSFDKN